MTKLPIQQQLSMLMMYYMAAVFWIVLTALLLNGDWFWHWSFAPLAMLLALVLGQRGEHLAPWAFEVGVIGPALCVATVVPLQLLLGVSDPLPQWSLLPVFLMLLAAWGNRAWQALRRDHAGGPNARLQRLGAGLRDLARLGQAALVLYALWFLVLLYAAAAGRDGTADKFAYLAGVTLEPAAAQSTLSWAVALLQAGHGWVVGVALGAVYAVQLWTLQRLHALGISLLRAEPLSQDVAARFRAMAHAILAFVLVDALLPGLLAWPLLDTLYLRFGMTGLFVGGCAVVCLHAIAILIEEGSRMATENRAFV